MRPLRPFPFPLNIGTDICQISRIHKILVSPRAQRFVQRVLAPEEQSQTTFGPGAPDGQQRGQNLSTGLTGRDQELWKTASFVAGRFAAKEAAIKAHSHRRLTFHDIVIERRGREEERLGSGPPVARIKAGEGVDEDTAAMISISHDGDYATAVCMAHDPSVTNN